MNKAAPASPSAVEAREKQRDERNRQKKMAKMATSWSAWLAFEKPLRDHEPKYLEELYRMVRMISQAKDLALNVDRQLIRWDEARDRVFTIEFLERTCGRFGKTHQQIHSDVGRVAGHNAWLSRLNRSGEYWMLSDIIAGMRKESDDNGLIFAPPAEPVNLTARGIVELTRKANEKFEQTTQQFLGDEPKVPRTVEFGFIEDVRRQARQKIETGRPLKKPRKNWRRER